MNQKRLSIVAIVLITLGLIACSSIPTHKPIAPGIEIESVRPTKLKLNQQELAIRLNVNNPNEYDLGLQNLSFTATVDGSHVATGSSDERVTLPANQDTVIEVLVSTRLNKLIGRLLLFSTSNEQSVNYEVSGFVKLSNWPARIPFNVDGALENPGLAQ